MQINHEIKKEEIVKDFLEFEEKYFNNWFEENEIDNPIEFAENNDGQFMDDLQNEIREKVIESYLERVRVVLMDVVEEWN